MQTESRAHNALDWAILGKREQKDTDWVIGFLEGKGLKRTPDEEIDDFQGPLEPWQAKETYGCGAQMLLRPPLPHVLHGSRFGATDRRGVGWDC